MTFTTSPDSSYKTTNPREKVLPTDLTARQKFLLAAMSSRPGISFAPVQVQKFFFLLDENISKNIGGKQFKFKPHNFGPFDRDVYVEFQNLSTLGLAYPVSRFEPPYQRRYSLTSEGYKIGIQELEKYPSIKGYIKDLAEWVQSLGFAELVGAIYKQYPRMRVNSIFQEEDT